MADRGNHGVPPSVDAFAQRLSSRGRAALRRWEWQVRAERRFPHEELQRRLADKGIPEWPFLWPLEEAFAGVEVQIGWEDFCFGITTALPHTEREELVDEHDRIRFVNVASWGERELLLDAAGRVYERTEPGAASPIDASIESFLEHHAMAESLVDWCPVHFTLYFLPRSVAAALADRSGVPPVIEASNDFHRWWQSDSLTLFAWPHEDTRGALWAKTLGDLVAAIDAAADICPGLEVQPLPSFDDAHKEVLGVGEIRARAPGVESLRARAGARRLPLLGRPSIHEGKPPSTGDVWISGEGETLRIDVLERREGEVVNYWELTPEGSHALLMSFYGKG